MNRKLPPFQKFTEGLINFKDKSQGAPAPRYLALPLVALVVFALLFARLFHLTIVKGAHYRFIAENNRIKEVAIEPVRGTIFDRKGMVIVESVMQDDALKRIYHDAEAMAHVVGYRQLADRSDLERDACESRLVLGDRVGKSGAEAVYECMLRGRKGKRLVEVDADGRERKVLSEVAPVPGKPVRLALDAELQKKTHELLTTKIIESQDGTVALPQKQAAVVATKPDTGEVVILASSPAFDPQVFEDNNQRSITDYLDDERQPLLNRALSGTYPPGSIFKLVVAAGALQDGVIDEDFVFEDKGTITAGPQTFGNWYFLKYGKTEGTVDIVKGIRRSVDTFFYKVGERLERERIKSWAHTFGYGEKTGILLPEEEGLVPSNFWKREVVGDRWYLGDTYNLAIGQGYLLTTPIQVNQSTGVFANGGKVCKPMLLKEQGTRNKEQKETLSECHDIGLSEKTLDLVREGMKQACETGGTGWPFFDFKVKTQGLLGGDRMGSSEVADDTRLISVGCKTGTAESQKASGLPHAWFTVFAPFEKPEIVLTVLVEDSGEGSNIAAPIAKEILKTYFERSQ